MRDVTYPGVYVEETSSAGRTIEGVATSTTAFIGATPRGRTRKPRLVTSFVEFEHVFGGLSPDHPITFSVRQFFEDGGRRALVCRVWRRRRRGRLTDDDLSHPELEAQRRGLWLLERVDEPVSIVVIPPLGREIDVGRQTWDAAVAWAKRRRAMVIVDPPVTWAAASDVTPTAIGDLVTASEDLTNAALYSRGSRPSIRSTGTGHDPSRPAELWPGSTPGPTSTVASGRRPPAWTPACKVRLGWLST